MCEVSAKPVVFNHRSPTPVGTSRVGKRPSPDSKRPNQSLPRVKYVYIYGIYLIEIYTEQNVQFQNFNMDVMMSLTTNQQLTQSLYLGVEFDCKLHQ